MTSTPVTATSSNSILNSYLAQQAQNQQATAAAATAASGGTTATNGIGSNLNTFLNILTTQLKNQDPTSATDPNQFTQELVQFAQVEQQLNTNTDLTTLVNLQKNSNGVAATLGYIGKYVEVPSTNQLSLQSSKAELAYNLPSSAASVSVAVTDSTGKTVATLSGTTSAGLNYLSWNGLDSQGNQLADGAYTFNVSALDSSGATISVTDTRTIGLVSSVSSNSDGTTSLGFGNGITVPSTGVDAVYQPGNLPTSTAV